MTHRTTLARINLDNGSDLVVSIDADGAADVRLWTRTGDLKFPSKDGVTIPRYAVRAVIDALANNQSALIPARRQLRGGRKAAHGR